MLVCYNNVQEHRLLLSRLARRCAFSALNWSSRKFARSFPILSSNEIQGALCVLWGGYRLELTLLPWMHLAEVLEENFESAFNVARGKRSSLNFDLWHATRAARYSDFPSARCQWMCQVRGFTDGSVGRWVAFCVSRSINKRLPALS